MLVGSTIHNIINISVNAHILYELSGVVWFGVVRSVTENIVFHRHVCKSRCCDTMRFVKESVVLHRCVLRKVLCFIACILFYYIQ